MQRLGTGAVVAVLAVITLTLPATWSAPAGAADAAPSEAGVAFLLSQQTGDGGFGTGSVTPEAVSAIAQQGQSGDEWSAKDAIDAVSAAKTPDHLNPLDALDALAQADPDPQTAAQLISRAVVALGLDPENFDPAGDGQPVDLVQELRASRAEDGSYGSVSATAEAVLALVLVGRQVTEDTVATLTDAQQHNGGWNADGEPNGTAVDPATTGLVIEALVASGAPTSGDTPAHRGLALLARTQLDNGAWPSERGGEPDPVATAWAMGAIRAAGYDPVEGCWRESADPEVSDNPYVSPATALSEAQGTDGAISGGVDPVTSTALGVQGLLGRWLPTARAEATSCSTGSSIPDVNLSLVFLAVFSLVVFAGAVYIMRAGR